MGGAASVAAGRGVSETIERDRLRERFLAVWAAEVGTELKEPAAAVWLDWVDQRRPDLGLVQQVLAEMVERIEERRGRGQPRLSAMKKAYWQLTSARRTRRDGPPRELCGLCRGLGYVYVVEGGQSARDAKAIRREKPEYHPYLCLSILPCKCSAGMEVKERPKSRWSRWPGGMLAAVREECAFRVATIGPPDKGRGPADAFMDECRALAPENSYEGPNGTAPDLTEDALAEAREMVRGPGLPVKCVPAEPGEFDDEDVPF